MTTNQNRNLPQRAAPTILSCLESDRWKQEIKKVLPDYLTPEMMIRISRSVASDPKFANCSPESFLLAMIKCSRAGLVPDGRNAHLIPFGTEVQAIFDWKGMVAMAQRNGVQVTAKLVYSEDYFMVEEDDGNGNTRVVHKVDFTKTRGEIVLVYSRAKNLKGGDVDYEFMSAEEVEAVRQNFSKAKDSLMWTKAWGEAAKKTVIRRHSKRWDLSPEDRAAINSDDDTMAVETTVTAPSRPLFAAPALGAPAPATAPAENGQRLPDEPASDEASEAPVTNPPPPPVVEPPTPEQKYLKAVRALCKTASEPEGRLLDLLAAIGLTDGDVSSLEDLAMTKPDVLKAIHDKWPEYAKRLKEAK